MVDDVVFVVVDLDDGNVIFYFECDGYERIF